MAARLPSRLWRRALAAVACAAVMATTAQAGQSCEEKPLAAEEARKSFGLALKVRQALDESGAQVVLLGRVGQDLSKYGLRYSHVGFVWRDHPEGRWLGVHLLNECGTAVSNLYNQGLANFFADDLFAWDALVLIPSPAVQQRLAEHLKGEAPLHFHQPKHPALHALHADFGCVFHWHAKHLSNHFGFGRDKARKLSSHAIDQALMKTF